MKVVMGAIDMSFKVSKAIKQSWGLYRWLPDSVGVSALKVICSLQSSCDEGECIWISLMRVKLYVFFQIAAGMWFSVFSPVKLS